MVRLASAIAALALGAQLASAIVVDLDCGNTLVPGKGNGEFSRVCVRDQTFSNADAQNWNFYKSKVTNTKFNAVTFKGEHNFENVEWKDVEFNKCSFEGTGRQNILFMNGTASVLTFNECNFEATAELIFTNMNVDKVKFNKCTFKTNAYFRSSTAKDVSFAGSTIGGYDKSLAFESVSTTGLTFTDSQITSALRFHSSKTTGLAMKGTTTLEDFFCGKVAGAVVSEHSAFIDAEIDGTQLKSFQCAQSSWDNMKATGITVANDVSFAGATMKNIKWDGVKRNEKKSASESCGKVDLSYGVVGDGDKISGIVSCNTTFRGTKFTAPVDFGDMDVANKDLYNFREATFAQTCVGKVSCVKLCGLPDAKEKTCTCGSGKDSDACDKAGSNVDTVANNGQPGVTNAAKASKKGSCFPADATVTLQTGEAVRMADLQHSHRIAVGGGKHSEVFFFGHRSASELTPFVHITTGGARKELRISPGHYIYANGKLVTARTVVVGDVLETGDGQAVSVTAVRTQLAAGLYAPATMHGNLVVDGIVVSSYTDALHPRVAHALLGPLRALHQAGLAHISSSFSLLHSRSAAPAARFLGFAGPSAVEGI
jgi:uncharacterized protein YjbI with pentapeptide repeats